MPQINPISGQVSDSSQGVSGEDLSLIHTKPETDRSGAESSVAEDSHYPDALLSDKAKPGTSLSDAEAGYDQAAYDEEVDTADEPSPAPSRGPASVLDTIIPSAGAADNPPPKGALQLKALRDEGISETDIIEWRKVREQALRDEKVPEEEIRAYFGDPAYDPKPMHKLAATALEWHPPMVKPDHEIGAKQAEGFLESIQAGYQGSAFGLAKRGKLPDIAPKADANFAEIVGHAVGQFAGDTVVGLPASVATAAGVGVGATAVTANPAVGAGAATVSGLFNFGFVPGAVRRSLIDYYNKGSISDSQDFMDRLTAATTQGVKEGVINLATAGAGKLGGQAAAKVVGESLGIAGSKVAAKAGSLAAEIPTMAAAGPAMEGRIPEKDDFYHAAVGVLALNAGMAAVGKTTGYVKGKAMDALEARVTENIKTKLENTYKDTGLTPTQVADLAEADPVLHAELISGSTLETPKSLEKYMEKPPESEKITTELPAELGGGEHTIEFNNGEKVAMAAEPPKAPEGTISPEAEAQSIRQKFESVTPETLEKMSGEEAKKLLLSRFKNTPDADGLFTGLDKNELRRRILDRYDPILRAQKMFTGTKRNKDAISALPASQNPYLLAANMNGVAGKVIGMIEYGTKDFATRKKNGESLTDITEKYRIKLRDSKEVKEQKQADIDGLAAYWGAKRIEELARRDVNKGADAVAVKKIIEEGRAKYDADAKRLVAFQDRILQYAVDSGLKSPEEAAAMRAQGEYYAPMNHIIEGKESPFGVGKGKLTVKDPFKAIKKGSDAPIIHPIESLVKNTNDLIAMSERNRVMKATRDMLEKFPEAIKKVETEEGKKLFNEAGEEVRQYRELAKDEIAVYDEGKRNIYLVGEDLATAFRGMDESSLGLLEKVLATSASFLRQGATKTPEFVLKNVVRDQLHAYVMSNNNYLPGISYFSGLLSMVKKDEYFQKFLDSGALGSTINTFDKNYVHSNILDVSKKTGMLKRSWNVVKSPVELGWHLLGELAEYGEQPTRLGEFKRALKKNGDIDSIFRAGYEARNITIDFARRGANVAALNAMIPFFNARNQGLDQLATALKENTGRTIARGSSLAVVSAALWAANRFDPRYQELKDWEKTLFWHVFTDKWVPAKKAEEGSPMSRLKDDGTWEMNVGSVLRIAKPQGLNLMFTAPLEAMLDQYTLDDPHGGEQLATAILHEFIPDGPQLPKLYSDMKANYSSFRDREIVPYFTEKQMVPFRYGPFTSEAAKWMSMQLHKAGISNDFTSPPMIEYGVQGMFGGLGTHALEAVGYALEKMGQTPKNLPQKEWDELPFVKSFYTRIPESSQAVDRYFQNDKEVQAPLLSFKAAEKRGNLSELVFITESNEYKIASAVAPGFKAAKKELKEIKENIEMISDSEEFSADDKTSLIDAQLWRRVQITQTLNKEYTRVKKAVEAGKDPMDGFTHELENESDSNE